MRAMPALRAPGSMSGANRLPGITFDKTLYLDYAQVRARVGGRARETASSQLTRRPPGLRWPPVGRAIPK